MSNTFSCWTTVSHGKTFRGVPCQKRTCDCCGPRIRLQQAKNILSYMEGKSIYLHSIPKTAGAMARLRQNIKLAGCEYLAVSGTGIFTDWQDGSAIRVLPDALKELVTDAVMNIPAGQRIKHSRGWSTARPARSHMVPLEKSEHPTYHYKVSLKEIIEIAESLKMVVIRTKDTKIVEIPATLTMSPEIEMIWVKKTGRTLVSRGVKRAA